MQLWNLNSSKLIYTFAGWDSPVTVLAQTPKEDVVAVGLFSGKIVIHNIKFDETLYTFIQDWGPVTNLSFCTEEDSNHIMASGTTVGHIVFWDLKELKVISQLLNAHNDSVTGLEYLPSEQLIVSSSPDNSLKMWLFDKSTESAHLFRVREGHKSAPSFVRFYGPLGNHILSAGSDGYLRLFNTETEIANKNLGRAIRCSKRALKKKFVENPAEYASGLLPIAQFASVTTREKEWDNIVAVHDDASFVSTWSFDKCKFSRFLMRPRMGTEDHALIKHKTAALTSRKLKRPEVKMLKVTSVFLTHCGNFALVGYNDGIVDKYNVQSAILKGSYGNRKKHCYVTGIYVNNVNHFMITGSSDHLIQFWSFKNHKRDPLYKIDVGDPVVFFRNHEESSLLAVGLENFSIILIDADSRSIVRKFCGHSSELTDFTFSPDCRWLVSASMDSTLRTWDIPSGKCVDHVILEKPCVSVSFSPTGTCIATAHVDSLGVTLWTNRCLFTLVSLGTVEHYIEDEFDHDYTVEDQMISFSANADLPITSRWQNMLSIDQIRKRNRLKEPPKVQPEAPFVLPIIPSVNIKFDLSDVQNQNKVPSDRIIQTNKLESSTLFAKLLLKADDDDDYEEAAEKLKGLSLSVIAFEINALSPESGGSLHLMSKFLKMLIVMFKSKKCFEIASAFLAQFLKAHCSLLAKELELIVLVESLYKLHDECWSNLEAKLLYSISLSKFFMNS